MAGLFTHQGALHTIKAWLRRSHLQGTTDKYIAHIKTEKTLTVREVAAAAVTRGGSTIDFDTMVAAVTAFIEELVYSLADGFGVALLRYFVIYPVIAGTFARADSPLDPDRHRLEFRFRMLKGLRDVIKLITVELQGEAGREAYISEVYDVVSGTADDELTNGSAFKVRGRHLKIAGPDPANGIYLISTATGDAVKVTGNLIQNYPKELIAFVPPLAPGEYRVRVLTQFTENTAVFLKEPHVVEYGVPLTVNGVSPSADGGAASGNH